MSEVTARTPPDDDDHADVVASDQGHSDDVRIDPFLGTRVHVVRARQARPNLPSTGCPFCPGGIEAPHDFDVRWFVNRWPAMHGDRCEVVLYTPHHDATFASLGTDAARMVIELWADRFCSLGARDDVDYVLIFENRGAEVGATIAHPHGQIYAYDHVPDRPRRLLEAQWTPDLATKDRLVCEVGGWRAWVPVASTYPIALVLAPAERRPDIASLDEDDRDGLAKLLCDVLGRLDRLFERPLPYMLWLNQRPTDGDEWPTAWFNIEIVSPWRRADTSRFIAAAEVAGGEYFNPVVPEELAADLRQLG
jgi:UDPglucose--hexose-1-phosphate uridylyltransferase